MAEMEEDIIMDPAVAWERVEGDLELLRRVIGLFDEYSAGLLVRIRQACARRDSQELHQAAHALKGTVGNFGARIAWKAALRLEKMGHTGTWDQAEETVAELEQAVALLKPKLALLPEVLERQRTENQMT